MGYPWWVYVLLFIVVGCVAVGAWWVYRQVKPHGTEDEYVERTDERDPLEAVEGFTRRWAVLQTNFMRRVALTLIVLCALIAVSLGINVTLYAAQNEDDSQQAALSQTNSDILRRLNMELRDRRERSARTDQQQCEDIEKLKSGARESAAAGRRTIGALTGLSAADKARLVESSKDQVKRFAPRRTVLPDGRVLVGLDACGVLPNADKVP